MRFDLSFSRSAWLVGSLILIVMGALLWLAWPEQRSAQRSQGPVELPARKSEQERYVPCPAGSQPKAGQPHICVPLGAPRR